MSDATSTIDDGTKHRIVQLATRAKRSATSHLDTLAASVVAILFVATQPTAAQTFGGAGEIARSAGACKIIPMIVGGLSLFLIVKGSIVVISGFDDSKSKSGKRQAGGRDKMKSGGKTLAGGLLGPGLIAGALDVLGVSLGCLSFDLGLLFISVPV